VTLLLALALVLAFLLGLRWAEDVVLELCRRVRELGLKGGRDLAARDRRVDGVLQLVGEPGGPALVAIIERIGDRVAFCREVGRDGAGDERLLRALVGAAPAGREREGQPQGDEGEQRPQARDSRSP
jgi:hypothetical protein